MAEFGLGELTLYGQGPLSSSGQAFPWRLAVGPDGTVWATDPIQNLVGRFGADGRFQELSVDVSAPSGIAFWPSKNSLIVAERFGRLLELDPASGRVRRVLAVGLDGAEALTLGGDRLFASFPEAGAVAAWNLGDGSREEVLEGLAYPTGLVAFEGQLFVAEAESGMVWEYSLADLSRRLAGETEPGLSGLTGLSPNRLVATNLLNGSLWELTPETGSARALVQGGAFPGGALRFELENRLFLAALTPVEFNTLGQTIHAPLLGSLYGRPEQFLGVVDTALADDGSVYYSLSEGMVITGWGSRTRVVAEGLDRPAGMVLGEQGTVYVAESGAGRVIAAVPGGGIVPIATALDEPVDLARAPEGGLLVVDRATGRLLLVGTDYPRVVRQDLNQPTAVATLPDGRAVVVEAGADRVLAIPLEGGAEQVLYQAEPGTLLPVRGTLWQVIGGLAIDPVRQTLFLSVPGRRAVVALPLP